LTTSLVYGLPVLGIVTCDVCLEIVNLAKRQTQDVISECWHFFFTGKWQAAKQLSFIFPATVYN